MSVENSSVKDWLCSKKKHTKFHRRSVARLLRDLQVVKSNPLPHVVAEPLPNDLYTWHGNIRGPDRTPYEGGVFHFYLNFDENYPTSIPTLYFAGELPPHPFVFGRSICLRMLEAGPSGHSGQSKNMRGWSPAFSAFSILCQLQSFFIDGLRFPHEVQTGISITFTQRQTSQWKEVFEAADKSGEGTLTASEIREVFLEIGERKPSEEELAIYYNMFHVQPDQPIEFSTFLSILGRKREFRKLVENVNKHVCDNSKCPHGPQQITPPFTKVPEDAFVATGASPVNFHAKEAVCFYTKRSFAEPDVATLGVGISYQRNPRNGKLHKVFASRDLVSLNAFRKMDAHQFPNISMTFTHWLPLYLNAEHGERAIHLLTRSLGIICTGSHRDFDPTMALEVIPRIIGGAVQEVATGGRSDATRALEMFTQLHHLMLVFMKRYPQTADVVLGRLNDFITNPASRVKDEISNLSDFLGLLSLVPVVQEITASDDKAETASGAHLVDIKALLGAIIQEINIRSVLWVVKKHPELEKVTPDEKIDAERIQKSFNASKAGYQLLLFHYHLYQHVARPRTAIADLIAEYNQHTGYPTQGQYDGVLQEFNRIQGLQNYEEAYHRLGLQPLDEAEQLASLRNAVQESAKNYYHCKRVIVVQSADEYLKEKLKEFTPLEDLIDEKASATLSTTLNRKAFVLKNDEEFYRSLANSRFGATELPENDPVMSDITLPWQHFYLKLNVEDLLCKFNENPDFKRFYRELELSAYALRSVEFTVVPVTNVKSNFFYLTALLTNLWNLEKFTVRKGEIFLDLKGCKALCKGLKNNPNSLRVLDLHYCHITPERIKILEDGLLSSESLVFLNMQGNPIGDEGASSIATVLRVHKQITHLNVGRCSIGDVGATVLAEAFYHNRSLQSLRMSQNRFSSVGLRDIFRKLAYSRTIRRLEVTRNEGHLDNSVAAELTRLFEVNTSLQYCNFYMTPIDVFFTAATLHGLSQNRSLTELDIGYTSFGANKVSELGWAVARNRNISILRMEKSQIGINGLTMLSEAIFDTPTAIEARAKAKLVRDLTTDEIYEELRPRGCSLEIVNLSQHSSQVETPRQVLALERLVSLSHSLVELNLSRCSLGVLAGDALGRGLKGHKTLLRLLLSGNQLDEHGVKKMCKGLNENSVLHELDISHNSIGGRGASAVGQLLANPMSQLRTLNLFGNFIGIEGARFIAEGLEKNASVTDLDLGLNRMRPKGVLAIAHALKTNSTLNVLRLKQNFINDKMAMELCEVLRVQPSISKLCIAGNKVKDAVLNSIVQSLSSCEKPVSVDVATRLSVTQRTRLSRTVYCTPLPRDVTVNGLKKVFYDGGCGAIINVSLLHHAVRKAYDSACYAFVEFAEEDSVQLALDIGSEGKAKTGKHRFSVIQAQGTTKA